MHASIAPVVCGLLFAAAPPLLAQDASKDAAPAPESIQVLILDGQNNHDFVHTTQALRATLIAAGPFRVDVSMSPSRRAGREAWNR